MRSRHLLLRLLLVAGLVLGQPAGFVHALSHVDFAAIRAASVELRRDTQPGAIELCEECLAFAQLAVAAPAPLLTTLPSVAAVANTGSSAIPRIAPAPVFASLPRGPPTA
jgi:hypothetical protein